MKAYSKPPIGWSNNKSGRVRKYRGGFEGETTEGADWAVQRKLYKSPHRKSPGGRRLRTGNHSSEDADSVDFLSPAAGSSIKYKQGWSSGKKGGLYKGGHTDDELGDQYLVGPDSDFSTISGRKKRGKKGVGSSVPR